jgi:signal transduction histidine kinase
LSEVFQDLSITLEELQVADEELRQQNEELGLARHLAEVERQRYQELFAFAPDAYLVTDTKVLVQEVNHAAAALLAVSKHHLHGKPLIVFVDPAEHRAFYAHLTHLKRTSTAHQIDLPAEEMPLGQAQATAIFRVFQEARTNVLRHAAANEVRVRMMHQPDVLTLQIADNGRGITPAQLAARHSFGLMSMRERAHLWGER